MNLNKVMLIGRLTADPQLRSTTGGSSVASFSVATNRNWVDKSGTRQEEVQFHNIVLWGRQAEVASQYLKKGGLVFIEGRLQTRSWQDNQGQARKTTEVVGERMQMGPRSAGSGGFSESGFNSGNSFSSSGRPPNKEDKEMEEPLKETMPEINLDEEDIKPEDIPF